MRISRPWLVGLAAAGVAAFAVWAAVRIAGLDRETQATNPIVRWEWVFLREESRDELWEAFTQHLWLTVLSVAIGLVLSALLAALALGLRWTFTPITAVAGFLYTIPSVALFAVLTAYVSAFEATVIALVSYTLLILVRNIVAGIDGVPAAVTDAADGLGMSRARRLRSVELPLAMPVILAGVRVATVTTVGLVAISAVIQLGGLGRLILDGYQVQFTTKMVVGSALSILLAVALDLCIHRAEALATPWNRPDRQAGR